MGRPDIRDMQVRDREVWGVRDLRYLEIAERDRHSLLAYVAELEEQRDALWAAMDVVRRSLRRAEAEVRKAQRAVTWLALAQWQEPLERALWRTGGWEIDEEAGDGALAATLTASGEDEADG